MLLFSNPLTHSHSFSLLLTHNISPALSLTHTHTDNISFSYTRASIALVLSLFTIHGHDQGHDIVEVYLLCEKPVPSYIECLITTMLVLSGYYFTETLYSTQEV